MKNEDLYDKRERELLDNPGRVAWKIIKWMLGLTVILGLFSWGWSVFRTPLNTVKNVVQKTLNADNVLQNYEWFKQQYQDYIAINQKITDADTAVARFKRDAGPRISWSFEDKSEYSRLNTISDGLRYQKADIAGKYNARSRMLNRDLFKTNELPDQLQN